MTLVELNDRIVGYNEREDRTWRNHAKLTAYLLTALTRKVIKGEDLMPEVYPLPLVYTKEEKRKELDDIKKSVGIH